MKEERKSYRDVTELRGNGEELLKTDGSVHYHNKIQAIDLITENGDLQGFCLGSIIKYASRYNRTKELKDLAKIKDYATILAGYNHSENLIKEEGEEKYVDTTKK